MSRWHRLSSAQRVPDPAIASIFQAAGRTMPCDATVARVTTTGLVWSVSEARDTSFYVRPAQGARSGCEARSIRSTDRNRVRTGQAGTRPPSFNMADTSRWRRQTTSCLQCPDGRYGTGLVVLKGLIESGAALVCGGHSVRPMRRDNRFLRCAACYGPPLPVRRARRQGS